MMKKQVLLAIILISFSGLIQAQDKPIQRKKNNGKSSEPGIGLAIPVGELSSTHHPGFTIHCSWSPDQLGRLDSLPVKSVSWVVALAGDYYVGKKVMVDIFNFQYAGYTNLRLFGGIIYHLGQNANIQLTGGPSLNIQNEISEFGYGANLAVEYYVSRRIGIQPNALLMKILHANPIWSIGFRVNYAL